MLGVERILDEVISHLVILAVGVEEIVEMDRVRLGKIASPTQAFCLDRINKGISLVRCGYEIARLPGKKLAREALVAGSGGTGHQR